MTDILTIDNGNTTTKLRVYTNSGVQVYAYACAYLDIAELQRIINTHDISCCALCSVGRLAPHIHNHLSSIFKDKFLTLDYNTPIPITLDYNTPHSLGSDRIAAACGAVSLIPDTPLLVVDAGTAVTIDFVDADATFLGGNISAGVNMRLQALNAFTSALPRINAAGILPPFGQDTETALRCGAVRGIVAEIEAAFTYASTIFPSPKLILTGGDAPLLHPLLSAKSTSHPDLMSLGLISILKHNEYI